MNLHTFHIPVMGIAYTIDSPIKVGHLGISSVVSIMDDEIIEKMNAFYSKKFNRPYLEISKKIQDYRSKRITSYLNLMEDIISEKFEAFKTELSESKTKLENYLNTLPKKSEIKKRIQDFVGDGISLPTGIREFIDQHLTAGKVDVNIMTKVDRENYVKSELLPQEMNDAHSALRGFMNSQLESSLILSAGLNPRLVSYMETFEDFYPSEKGEITKKIVLKVSDFRSAMIQGNFMAKKGLWVSEFRIESGLNCGGHAFATEGLLLGPILEEFKTRRAELTRSMHQLMTDCLLKKDKIIPNEAMEIKITVQGGVGTAEEHQFLLDHYQVDSVGWGSPFLLVPEATTVDKDTIQLLAKAKEEDLYLSHISPLGIPFNTVKNTTNDYWKEKRIAENKSGSACTKKFLALDKEYSMEGICTGSKKFQDRKLAELEIEKSNLSTEDFQKRKNKITEKACLCVGLGNSALMEHGMEIKGQQQGVIICPGPNMAYYDREYSLSTMMKHIYGNIESITTSNRPNVFVKELNIYVSYLKNEIKEIVGDLTVSQIKKYTAFNENLQAGIQYYKTLFAENMNFMSETVHKQFELMTFELQNLKMENLKVIA
ncbi:MAG: hypothetical protein PHQ74_01275 [Crocinitomicaceae bacterium]|nr:hypothetical protein [Crocinitomicaceae bacterium]